MKKYLLLAATATLLASCTKESTLDQGAMESTSSQMIAYGTYANINTKGKPIVGNDGNTGNVLQVENNAFDVVAYLQSGSKYAKYLETTVTYGTDSWSAAKNAYWPSDDAQKLTFMALYPSGHVAETTGNNLSNTANASGASISFTHEVGNMAAQEDLMYATTDYINNYTGSSADRAVTLNFHHALTQINFTAAVNDASYKLLIDKVAIGGVDKKGDFTVSGVASNAAGSVNLCGWDFSNYATGNTNRYEANANGTDAATTYVTTSGTDPIKICDNNATGAENGHSLMLLPQTFDAWNPAAADAANDIPYAADSDNGGYIAIDCVFYQTLNTGTAGDDIQVSLIGKYDDGGSHEFVTVYIPIKSEAGSNTATNTEWVPGRAITYNLTFGPNDGSGSGGGGYIPTDPDPETPGDPDKPKDPDPTPALAIIKYTTAVVDWVDYSGDSVDDETSTELVKPQP